MRHVLHNDVADLRKYPLPKVRKSQVVAQGDLHGNTLKLLHFALEHGILKWPSSLDSKQQYDTFYKYYFSPITKHSLTILHKLINELVPGDEPPLVIYLGDELADRGLNDLCTLWLFYRMHELNIPYRVCFSNHLLHFLIVHHRIMKEKQSADSFARHQYSSNIMLYECLGKKPSQLNGYLDENTLQTLIDAHCSHLGILFVGFQKQEICLYTHAIVSHRIARHLAQYFGLYYVDNTPEELAWSVEAINQHFREELREGRLLHLFNDRMMSALSNELVVQNGEALYPLEHITWNRNFSNASRPPQHPSNPYHLFYVHGHDARVPPFTPNIISLDADLGRTELMNDGKRVMTCVAQNPILHGDEQHLTPESYLERTRRIEQDSMLKIRSSLSLEPNDPNFIKTMETYLPLLLNKHMSDVHRLLLSLLSMHYNHLHTLPQSSAIKKATMVEQHQKELEKHIAQFTTCGMTSPLLNEILHQWRSYDSLEVCHYQAALASLLEQDASKTYPLLYKKMAKLQETLCSDRGDKSGEKIIAEYKEILFRAIAEDLRNIAQQMTSWSSKQLSAHHHLTASIITDLKLESITARTQLLFPIQQELETLQQLKKAEDTLKQTLQPILQKRVSFTTIPLWTKISDIINEMTRALTSQAPHAERLNHYWELIGNLDDLRYIETSNIATYLKKKPSEKECMNFMAQLELLSLLDLKDLNVREARDLIRTYRHELNGILNREHTLRDTLRITCEVYQQNLQKLNPPDEANAPLITALLTFLPTNRKHQKPSNIRDFHQFFYANHEAFTSQTPPPKTARLFSAGPCKLHHDFVKTIQTLLPPHPTAPQKPPRPLSTHRSPRQ